MCNYCNYMEQQQQRLVIIWGRRIICHLGVKTWSNLPSLEQSHLYQARKNIDKPRLSKVAHSKLTHFLIFVFMISTSIGQLVKAALRIKLKATMIEWQCNHRMQPIFLPLFPTMKFFLTNQSGRDLPTRRPNSRPVIDSRHQRGFERKKVGRWINNGWRGRGKTVMAFDACVV